MGYYKNMEIEQQVEMADRVPKPKGVPTSRRLAYTSTRATDRASHSAAGVMRRRCVWALSILGGDTCRCRCRGGGDTVSWVMVGGLLPLAVEC
jgi:hypothetical protein